MCHDPALEAILSVTEDSIYRPKSTGITLKIFRGNRKKEYIYNKNIWNILTKIQKGSYNMAIFAIQM